MHPTLAKSCSQKGKSPLFRFTCQKFILSKIKRSCITLYKQNKHKTCVPKACATKKIMSKSSGGALGVNVCMCEGIPMYSHALIQMGMFLRGHLHFSEP